jgi:DNA-binding Lrp family transcriptional regulator
VGDELEFRLLNEFQRAFPVEARPYARVAEQLGVTEDWVLARIACLQRDGAIARVGAVFVPGAFGASTLAALEVPPERLDEVAALVSARPEVNHNYERENRINLWFVAMADSAERLRQVLREIELAAMCGPLLDLRMVEEFRIDLGFDLRDADSSRGLERPRAAAEPRVLTDSDRRLLVALQEGLPIVAEPYAALASAAGLAQSDVLERLRDWVQAGVIRRLGVVVRHRELGYRCNAMVVWDVPDAVARPFGLNLAQQPGVTLCYRRVRRGPRWPYNLYCMVHGRSRDAVRAQLQSIHEQTGLGAFPSQVLFSRTRFKQTGARYISGKDFAYG